MWPFNRIKLFWKIFIWFWLAMALMVGLSVFSWLQVRDSIHFYPSGIVMQKSLHRLSNVLASNKPEHWQNRAIRKLLRTQSSWLFDASKKRRAGSVYFLIDAQGNEKNNKKVPEAISALGNANQSAVRPLFATHKDRLFVGPQKVLVGGQSYNLFITQSVGKFHSKIVWHIMHSISILQIFGYLVISILLCLLLAYSITLPIKKLQRVSRSLAAGESVLATEVLKRRRDEFFSLAKDLDQMTQKILSAVDSQKQLLSDVSHELRSPLARLQIAAGLLEKDVDTDSEMDSDVADNYQKNIARVQMECDRMDRMIGQLLNIAALDRGQVYEAEQMINLVDLLLELKDDAQFEAAQKSIEIVALTPADHSDSLNRSLNKSSGDSYRDFVICGYYQLLRSAIENIVRNAIRYSPENQSVVLELTMNGEIVISVKDAGEGIADEDLEKVFLPFYRTDKARVRDNGGTGLGLAISARAIQVMGGRIEAENLSDGGFKVSVYLPG